MVWKMAYKNAKHMETWFVWTDAKFLQNRKDFWAKSKVSHPSLFQKQITSETDGHAGSAIIVVFDRSVTLIDH